MNPELGIRLLEAGAIIVAALGLYWLFNRWILARVSGRARGLSPGGQPAIVYFTTPGCAPCRTIQRPALDDLKARLGERLEIVEIDAAARPDLARDWGVLSVPTTFVIDSTGRSRYVNHGVADAEKLLGQVERISTA
jgi:thiol-disulfide isomerase/thioredoxin